MGVDYYAETSLIADYKIIDEEPTYVYITLKRRGVYDMSYGYDSDDTEENNNQKRDDERDRYHNNIKELYKDGRWIIPNIEKQVEYMEIIDKEIDTNKEYTLIRVYKQTWWESR